MPGFGARSRLWDRPKAHGLSYHSTLGSRVIQQEKRTDLAKLLGAVLASVERRRGEDCAGRRLHGIQPARDESLQNISSCFLFAPLAREIMRFLINLLSQAYDSQSAIWL